jgi:gamma-D-glutamyl-L-lysine dipeptidyl-peptidase
MSRLSGSEGTPTSGERSLVASSPVPVLATPEPQAELVTELVAGEPLSVLEESGGWLRVVVPEHRTRLDERGYPGWVPPDSRLVPARGWSPDLVVARPNRAGLPLGVLLRGAAGEAILPDGKRLELAEAGAVPAGGGGPRSALALSRLLLGLPYRWGGTDSTTGMDCSGLVYRVMQVLGLRIPRDSGDQFDLAPFKSEACWRQARPGDLVFFGADSVTHVGFYLGDGRYLSEHGSGGAMVRAMTDDPYRGFARYEPNQANASEAPRTAFSAFTQSFGYSEPRL